MKILVVEDNKILRLTYELMFKKLSLSFCLAETASEAIAFYKENGFDLVLSDFYLPDMEGSDLCKELRALTKQKGKKRIPILLITAAYEKVIEGAGISEFDDVIDKPLTEEKLKEIIATYL